MSGKNGSQCFNISRGSASSKGDCVSNATPLPALSQTAKPSRHLRLIDHIRVQLKGVLVVLDADCQLMPRSTPFNNSGLGPHKILRDKKQSGSSSALASTLRALTRRTLSPSQESHRASFWQCFQRDEAAPTPIQERPEITVTIGMNTSGNPAGDH